MKSPIEYILQDLWKIPTELLEQTFTPEKFKTTLDQCIIDQILKGFVLNDINQNAGRLKTILLQPEWVKETRDKMLDPLYGMEYVSLFFWIPPEAREHRNITNIIDVNDEWFGVGASSMSSLDNLSVTGNTLSSFAQAMTSSYTLSNTSSMPRATLEGNNLIRCEGSFPNSYIGGLRLRCWLDYDQNLTNLPQDLLYPIRDLFNCAVKAYIYNKLIIPINQGEVISGQEIGVFKEIVQSYEGQLEEYNHHLNKVYAGNIMSGDNFSTLVAFAV